MENKKNDSLKSNKKLIKNKYVEPIITIGLSISVSSNGKFLVTS